MENINILTLSKTFSPVKIKNSMRHLVRDIDETSPLNYVAYVDHNNDSYDVSIKLSPEKDVLEINCDCDTEGICTHKLALMLHLSKTNAQKKAQKNKKTSKHEEIIESLDYGTLKNWVLELIKKNKDLELLFVSEFGVSQKEFNTEEVVAIIKNTIKTVIGNRKNIGVNDLKKIVDLLDVALKPVLSFCFSDLSNDNKFSLIYKIFDTLDEFNAANFSNSNKILKFIEKLNQMVVLEIISLKEDEKIKKIIDTSIGKVLGKNVRYFEKSAFEFLKNLYNGIFSSNEELEKYFRNKFKEILANAEKKGITYNVYITTFILKLFLEKGDFESVHQYFSPFRYENHYNLLLIDGLIGINRFDKAEEFAKNQIKTNSDESYNLEYWNKLLIIYKTLKNDQKTAEILKETLLFTYNFEDYKWLKKVVQEEEFKVFRKKIDRRAAILDEYPPFNSFYFKICIEEKNFKKLIERVKKVNYSTIYEFREELYLADKTGFLNSLNQSNKSFYYIEEKEKENKEKLFEWLKTKYTSVELENIINPKKYY